MRTSYLKFSIILLVAPLFIVAQNNDTSTSGFIHFYYYGENSKPYPQIRFYLPGDVDTLTENFVYNYRVTIDTFYLIKTVVQNRAKDSAYHLPEGFFIRIKFRSTIETAFITDLNVLKGIFLRIIQLYYNKEMEFELKIRFDQLLRRLGATLGE